MNQKVRIAYILGVIASLPVRDAAGQSPPVATSEVRNVVPAAAAVEQFVMTPDSLRTYYRVTTGGVWMYDRNTKAATRIIDAMVWDLAVSPAKNLLAYTKLGDNAREQYVWAVPLSPTTGLPSAKERQVSTHAGDVPSISPDGKRIAFARDDDTGVGQTVVVVPITGGTERVIAASQPSGVSSIRWTPDGKRVYYGVNAPVPFTCAESCLTGARESRPSSTIRRVSATGGAMETIATVGLPGPGLSPDGKYLVFGDTGAPRRLVVADANGKRITTFSPPASQSAHGWSGASTLLTLQTGQVTRLRTLTLPDGAPRVLFENTEFNREPSWSPDGRAVAVIRFGNTGCELKVMNNDGSAQRSIALGQGGNCFNAAWSGDGRWIVFNLYRPNAKPAVAAVEAATGRLKELRTSADDNPLSWVLDGDVVVLTEATRDNTSRRAIWQVDLTGNARLLRELRVDEGATVTLLDRNQAIITPKASRDVRVVSLTTGEERTISLTTSGYVFPRPSVSADRQWVALLVAPTGDNTQLTRLELLKLDQSARKTIELPFRAAIAGNILVLPGATGVVVDERRVPGAPANVHFVDASTKTATKLFSYVPSSRQAEFRLSPDGRTVLYLLSEQLPPIVSAIDITTLR